MALDATNGRADGEIFWDDGDSIGKRLVLFGKSYFDLNFNKEINILSYAILTT